MKKFLNFFSHHIILRCRSVCLMRGSILVSLREPIATCDWGEGSNKGVLTPSPLPPSRSAHVTGALKLFFRGYK